MLVEIHGSALTENMCPFPQALLQSTKLSISLELTSFTKKVFKTCVALSLIETPRVTDAFVKGFVDPAWSEPSLLLSSSVGELGTCLRNPLLISLMFQMAMRSIGFFCRRQRFSGGITSLCWGSCSAWSQGPTTPTHKIQHLSLDTQMSDFLLLIWRVEKTGHSSLPLLLPTPSPSLLFHKIILPYSLCLC